MRYKDCDRRAPNQFHNEVTAQLREKHWSKKLLLIRFLLTNTGQQGRHTRVWKEGLFFIKWYFQELKYNSTGRVIDTHSMVSVAGVKLAAKHVQLHNCSAMGKLPTDLWGFGLARDEATGHQSRRSNCPRRPNLTSSLSFHSSIS